jgi:DNA replication protein DnaC
MRHDPAAAAIIIMLRSLKMHGMAQAAAELTEQGAPALQNAISILSHLLKAEIAEREVRSIAYQLKAARFPTYKDLTCFDFASSQLNEALVRQLHAGAFTDSADNIVLVGGPGTGKTHVATTLGVQAVEHHRKRVRFFSTVELVNMLEQEKAAGKAGQIATRLLHVDLLILDELGYLPFSASGGAVPCCFTCSASCTSRPVSSSPPTSVSVSDLRRCQDDHCAHRPAYPPLPHPGNRQRQLPLQEQFCHPGPA